MKEKPKRGRAWETLLYIYSALIVGEALRPGLWPDAITYLPPVVFWTPPALFLLSTLKTKSWRNFAPAIVSLLVIAFSPFGPSLGCQEAEGTHAFTVVSWNIKHGWRGAADVVDHLAGARPDVILLQEAQENVAIHLLETAMPDYTLLRSAEAEHDVAVFTRFPVKRLEPIPDFPGFEIVASLRVGSENVKLVNVHLDKASKSKWPVRSIWRTARMHAEAGEKLSEFLAKASGPCIVAGDFNAPSASPVVRELPLREVRGRGFEATFPDALPAWRLDHILISRQLKANDSWVEPINLSDHRPVWARLSFR